LKSVGGLEANGIALSASRESHCYSCMTALGTQYLERFAAISSNWFPSVGHFIESDSVFLRLAPPILTHAMQFSSMTRMGTKHQGKISRD